MSSRVRLSSSPGISRGLLAVTLAIAAHAATPPALSTRLPFFSFALAVLAACRWGGRSAGAIATVFSAIILHAWYLAPATSFFDEGRFGLGLFLAAGAFVTMQAVPASASPEDKSLPMFRPATRVAPTKRNRLAA